MSNKDISVDDVIKPFSDFRRELRKVWNFRFSSKISWESFLEISAYTIGLKDNLN